MITMRSEILPGFDEARDGLRARGYALVRQAVSTPLLTDLQAEADSLIRRFTEQGFHSADYWSFTPAATGEPVLYRIHNLQNQGAPRLTRLFAGGPLHSLATALLGVTVRATACAMIVKMPHVAAAVPWHRDRCDIASNTVSNLSLFLDDSDADNGCLQFVPESHLLPDNADVAAVREAGPVRLLFSSAGDVALHDVRAVHASLPNASSRIRRSVVVEFAPADMELP
jgi:ectoine hydroxylase-related dioxygenase (phytanoyl-CoA dioxygenase family)